MICRQLYFLNRHQASDHQASCSIALIMSVVYNKTESPFGPIVNGTQIIFFEYLPNEAAAWIFVVLFFLAAVVHLGLLIWLRAWHFLPLTLGAVGPLLPEPLPVFTSLTGTLFR